MDVQPFEQVILNGIQGLPHETLAEIATFVYAVRKRVLHDEGADDDLWEALLRAELKQLSRDSEAHVEDELAEYNKLMIMSGRLQQHP